MFNSELFLKLCMKYNVDITDNSTNLGLFLEMDNGEITPLTPDLFEFIIGESISY